MRHALENEFRHKLEQKYQTSFCEERLYVSASCLGILHGVIFVFTQKSSLVLYANTQNTERLGIKARIITKKWVTIFFF